MNLKSVDVFICSTQNFDKKTCVVMINSHHVCWFIKTGRFNKETNSVTSSVCSVALGWSGNTALPFTTTKYDGSIAWSYSGSSPLNYWVEIMGDKFEFSYLLNFRSNCVKVKHLHLVTWQSQNWLLWWKSMELEQMHQFLSTSTTFVSGTMCLSRPGGDWYQPILESF